MPEFRTVNVAQEDVAGQPDVVKLVETPTVLSAAAPNSRAARKKRKVAAERYVQARKVTGADPVETTGRKASIERIRKSQGRLITRFVVGGARGFTVIQSGEATPIRVYGISSEE